jgi:hypothetical protein
MTNDPSPESKPPFSESTAESAHLQRILYEDSVEHPDFCRQVMAQIEKDLEHPIPCQYDYEFISTYFDDELSLEVQDTVLIKQRLQTFEQHLPQCPPCNESLGYLFDFTQLYRSHLYRLETQLDAYDCVSSVMAALARSQQGLDLLDESIPLPEVGCGEFSLETLSSYSDEALSKEETEAVASHLKTCEPCQAVADDFISLNQTLGSAQERLVDHADVVPALDLWPRIQAQLQNEAKPETKVVALEERRKRLIPVTSAAIAASVLLMLFSGRLLFQAPESPAPKAINVAALQEAMIADEKDAQLKKGTVPAVNVIYESPEAYLFSSESDLPVVEDLNKMDVSALVLEESP